jgi:hypothetical protein
LFAVNDDLDIDVDVADDKDFLVLSPTLLQAGGYELDELNKCRITLCALDTPAFGPRHEAGKYYDRLTRHRTEINWVSSLAGQALREYTEQIDQ